VNSQSSTFNDWNALVTELTAKFNPDDKLHIKHEDKIISIVTEHLGKRAARSRIRLKSQNPTIILNADSEPISEMLKDDQGKYYLACFLYASYICHGPLVHQQLEQVQDHLMATIKWDEPELDADGRIKGLSGSLPEDTFGDKRN